MKSQSEEYKFEISEINLWGIIKKFACRDSTQHSLAYRQLLNKLEFPSEKDHKDMQRWISNPGGNINDKIILAMAHHYGLGVTKQEPASVFQTYQRLKNEDPNNNFLLNNLACCYQYGYGVLEDSKQAFIYFKQAAEQGESEAMNNLAFCFQEGIGTAINLIEAKIWLQAATQADNPRAKYRLSPENNQIDHHFIPSLNFALEFTERKQTLSYLQIAAERGNSQALFHLGTFHRYGCFLNTQNEDPPEAPQPEKALEIFKQLINSLHFNDNRPPDYGYWKDCWPDIVIALSYTAEYYKEQIHQDEKYVEKAFDYSQKLILLHEQRTKTSARNDGNETGILPSLLVLGPLLSRRSTYWP